MKQKQYIIESCEPHVGYITLNRPEVHNALNIEMIREIAASIEKFNKKRGLRMIIINANGANFSAGADLKWMKKGLEQSEKELLSESLELAKLFNTICNSSIITIAVASGKVIGGANGIIAAADISVATENTSFTFSEVKLGLIPATIAPYIVRRTGENVAREWMITGREIPAREAHERGLLNIVVPHSDLTGYMQQLSKTLLGNGPQAMKGIKKMFSKYELSAHPDQLLKPTAKLIAKYRVSEEGQEGIKAFFEKRKPAWNNE
jgi:methylglutaconyl-CoA hydratase